MQPPPQGYLGGPPRGPKPQGPTTAHTIDLVVRFLLSVIFTPVMVAMAISTQQYQLLAVLVITLAVVSALGGGHGLLERHPALGRVRLLGGVLRLTGDLDAFYTANPPRSFFFYILYPLYALIGPIASRTARR